MTLNLLVASLLGAFDDHTKSEKSAISKYDLETVLSLWSTYDPQGTQFLTYKEFWRLSSEIAIHYGVKKEDLLDVNNKKRFLRALKLPIYEHKKF